VRIPIETGPRGLRVSPARTRRLAAVVLAGLALTLAGCGGEPSRREVQNARAFEALLTAVSLRNRVELEKDAQAIEDRHTKGDLTDANYQVLREVIEKARSGDWTSAERGAYEFRKLFGDHGAYFE
jgi:hypothetical protein